MGGSRGVEARANSIRITFTLDGQSHKHTLKTNGEPMSPTPANLKYAARVAEEIRQKIKFGAFRLADYFPDDDRSTSGLGVTTVGDRLDEWLGLRTDLKSSSINGYQASINWWKAQIGNKPLPALVHSDILKALATKPEWSGKTRNNKVSLLRQMLELAIRDGLIKANPLDGLEPASHQKPEPDPFQMHEVQLILGQLEKTYGEQIANYFGFKFFTGLRTGESMGLRWRSIDWPSQTMVVKEGVVMGEHVESTKTSKIRQVHLNSSALFYLQRQKAHSFLLPEGWVFVDPKTHKRFVDDWVPRNIYWEPALKKLGLRYRSPYQTRHTYATMMLMAGMTPAFAAKQMGHGIQMFLSIYARWLDGGQNAIEMGKLEGFLGQGKQEKSSASSA
jgi:integrase